MIHCLIFKEDPRGQLAKVGTADVPDNSADPETAAWATYSRGKQLNDGSYSVVRVGKRFTVVTKHTATSSAAGPMQ